MFTKKGQCSGCKITVDGVLHRHFRQNGAQDFMWICPRCNRRDPFRTGLFIGKERVQQHLTTEEIEQLPVIVPEFYNRCVRCGSRDCELHHWAPRAIFGKDEAEQWPKDYLCKACHDEWHHKVTPELVK